MPFKASTSFPAQPFCDLIGSLADQHVRGLIDDHASVVAARIRFGRASQGGAARGYSEAQMRRRWDQIRELVLMPLGLPAHDDFLAGMWMVLHRTCCAANMFVMLGSDSRFASKSA